MRHKIFETAEDFIDDFSCLVRKDEDSARSVFLALYSLCFGFIDPKNRSEIFASVISLSQDIGLEPFEDSMDVIEHLQEVEDERIKKINSTN